MDDLVAAKMLEIEALDRYKAPLVMEGGSIHVDGQGTLITTEQCLLHPNRNPSAQHAAEIETIPVRLSKCRKDHLAAARRV